MFDKNLSKHRLVNFLVKIYFMSLFNNNISSKTNNKITLENGRKRGLPRGTVFNKIKVNTLKNRLRPNIANERCRWRVGEAARQAMTKLACIA